MTFAGFQIFCYIYFILFALLLKMDTDTALQAQHSTKSGSRATYYVLLLLLGFMNDGGFLLFLNACITMAQGGAVVGKLKSLLFTFEPHLFIAILAGWFAIQTLYAGLGYKCGSKFQGVAGMWMPMIPRVVCVLYSLFRFKVIKSGTEYRGYGEFLRSNDNNEMTFTGLSVCLWTVLLFLIVLIPTHTKLIAISIFVFVLCIVFIFFQNRVSAKDGNWYVASPGEYNDGFTLLHLAVINDHTDAVQRLLITNEVEINKRTSMTGYSALALAALQGHIHSATLLLEHGADANSQTDAGVSPLMLAAINGHSEVVKLLRQHGADEDHMWMGLKANDMLRVEASDTPGELGEEASDTPGELGEEASNTPGELRKDAPRNSSIVSDASFRSSSSSSIVSTTSLSGGRIRHGLRYHHNEADVTAKTRGGSALLFGIGGTVIVCYAFAVGTQHLSKPCMAKQETDMFTHIQKIS